MAIDKLKEVLWSDVGILAYARSGNSLSEEDRALLTAFTKEINQKLRDGNCPVSELLLLVDTIEHLQMYPATKHDGSIFYEMMMDGVEF